MNFGILIVDDEIEVCRSLQEILNSRGYRAGFETEPTKVPGRLDAAGVDLIIMDLRMPELGGIDLLKLVKKSHPDVVVFVISGYATVDTAVRAMKYGAFNVFTKPIKVPLLLKEIEQVAASFGRRRHVGDDSSFVTKDQKVKDLLAQVEMAAPTDAAVLITGESGTGKELVANTLHNLSRRRKQPLIKINCASIPDALLESEMFGYEPGAFTDAKEQKRGLFELARGGSIFLDEIGDMSAGIQAKMLRVLHDKQFIRLGGAEIIDADCRIIAATNRDLGSAIRDGAFREDLFYRLAVINLHMPPLRERRQDILPIAEHFRRHFSHVYSREVAAFSEEVRAVLLGHSWPGNVRELRNFVERAIIFSRGDTIELGAMPDQYREFAGNPERELFDRYCGAAREVLIEALSKANGKKQDAARLLQIDRKTLYNRMKKFKLL